MHIYIYIYIHEDPQRNYYYCTFTCDLSEIPGELYAMKHKRDSRFDMTRDMQFFQNVGHDTGGGGTFLINYI